MNRSSKYQFYLPQNTDPISVSDFNYNFTLIDSNLITASQSWTSTQKSTARTNLGLGDAATSDVANNHTTSSSGSVLDAREGKALYENIFYTKDNTFSYTSNLYGYGFVTSSNKVCSIIIPMPRNFPSGGTFSVTSCKARVRGIDGNLDVFTSTSDEIVGRSGYSVAVSTVNNGRCLNVQITKTSNFTNSTNETPVMAALQIAFNATWS